MKQQSPILVIGADTLSGAAILRELQRQGYGNVTAASGDGAAAHLDTGQTEYVFVAAGKSGGIKANQQHPADLMLDNLLITTRVMESAHRHGVRKLMYLASSCIYPKHCPQPMQVSSLLTGPLEPTSEAYAVAKIAGVKLCQAYRQQHGAHFITVIPADIFGPGSKFSAEDSHVVAALIVKMHEAKQRGDASVTIWGTGNPQREFTFADDLANACLLVMREYDGEEPINIGSGEPVAIRALAELVREVVGFEGEVRWDTSRPDGAPIKLLDSSRLRAMGWHPATTLEQGLRLTYQSFLALEQQKEQAQQPCHTT